MSYHYSINDPKNLHNRIISESGNAVTFRNMDGQPEEQQIVKDYGISVLVCSKSGDWLNLWRVGPRDA